MRIGSVALTAVLGIVLGGSIHADDIVYFTNGTTMPVRSHRIEKGMIRVELGSNAAMAFPVAMVEKVESAGRSVFPNATGPANQALAGAGNEPNTVQTGYASVPAQFRQSATVRRDAVEMDPEQQLARARNRENSAPGYPAGTNTAAKRNLRIMAGQPTLNEDGTYRRGNVSVMDMPGAPVSRQGGDDSKPTIVSLGPNTDAPAAAAGRDSGASPDNPPPPER